MKKKTNKELSAGTTAEQRTEAKDRHVSPATRQTQCKAQDGQRWGILQRFRKKPIDVEAVQFLDKNKDEVYSWAKSIQANVYHSWEDGKPCLKVPTLEGEMICSLGDFLIKEPFPTDWRKLYPCKEDIFFKTYEPLFGFERKSKPFSDADVICPPQRIK